MIVSYHAEISPLICHSPFTQLFASRALPIRLWFAFIRLPFAYIRTQIGVFTQQNMKNTTQKKPQQNFILQAKKDARRRPFPRIEKRLRATTRTTVLVVTATFTVTTVVLFTLWTRLITTSNNFSNFRCYSCILVLTFHCQTHFTALINF